jgi:5-methylcytosine-specific restriction endonuclease McrA
VSQCKECHKAKHGAKALEYGRISRQKPGVNRDRKNKHKALKRNAPNVEYVSRRVVYDRDDGKCYMCGKELPFNGFDLEHVIPLARGGNHTYDNVKVACRSCNARKHTKLLKELDEL